MTTRSMIITKSEPEFICSLRDDSMGLLGYLVVDASIGGHACGGLRMSRSVSVDELKNLARSMTLKYGFNHMAQGGAKAGIVAEWNVPVERRHALLRRFGQLLGPLLRERYYYSGPDMNVTAEDIEVMLDGAGVRFPAPRKRRGKKSGLYTAMGVMVAAEAAASVKPMSLEGKSIAIEGFGAVGSALAMLMTRKKKAKVVAISTTEGALYNPAGLNIEQLLKLRERCGNTLVNVYEDADRIENEELLLLDVDILAPCARQFPITGENAGRLRAPLFCPGANNPITPEAEQILFERGVMVIPDFVANGGGVLGNKVEVLGVEEDFIESYIRQRNFERIRSLIVRSREIGEPMHTIAERAALKAFSRMQDEAKQPNMASFVHRAGLRAFNAGLIPGFITRPLAPMYLKRMMSVPRSD